MCHDRPPASATCRPATVDDLNEPHGDTQPDTRSGPASATIHPGTPPKTEASTRLIPADDWVLERVAAHLATFGARTDGVIIHYGNRPMDAAKFGHYVRMARKRAGLPRTVSFHDLRHFFASALIHAGCGVKQVQLALGHKSARMTLDVYGHLWPGEEDRVRDAIGRVFRPAADFPRTSRNPS